MLLFASNWSLGRLFEFLLINNLIRPLFGSDQLIYPSVLLPFDKIHQSEVNYIQMFSTKNYYSSFILM